MASYSRRHLRRPAWIPIELRKSDQPEADAAQVQTLDPINIWSWRTLEDDGRDVFKMVFAIQFLRSQSLEVPAGLFELIKKQSEAWQQQRRTVADDEVYLLPEDPELLALRLNESDRATINNWDRRWSTQTDRERAVLMSKCASEHLLASGRSVPSSILQWQCG